MTTIDTVTLRALQDRVASRIGRDEARTLLSLMLDMSPAALTLQGDHPIPPQKAEAVLAAAMRRQQDVPLAYCAGRGAFRHLVLDVDERVLIPRPETEMVVDEILAISNADPGGVAVDVGTGSGAIALSLAAEGRFDRIVATDVSVDALQVARANLRHLPEGSTPVELRSGAGLKPLEGLKARVLASNPPYIAYEEAPELPPSVRDWEPPMALFAGDGGMHMYDMLFREAERFLEPAGRGWLVVEVDARRATQTAERAAQCGYLGEIRLVNDLTGRKRVLVARTTR